MNTAARANVEWKAAQGNNAAQQEFAAILQDEGRHDWAAFYRAKARGDAAFTLQAFQAQQVERMVKLAECDEATARAYLEAEEWDIEEAVISYKGDNGIA